MALDDRACQALKQIIERYGDFSSHADDIRRCHALLLDLAGSYRLENNLLVHALEIGTPEILRTSLMHDLVIARLIGVMQQTYGVTKENARWAVESWAIVLGYRVPKQPEISKATNQDGDDIESHQLDPGRWYEPDEYLSVLAGNPRRLTADELNDLVSSVADEFEEDGSWIQEYEEDEEDEEEETDEEPRRSKPSRKLQPAEPVLKSGERFWDEQWKSCYVEKKLDAKRGKAIYHVEGSRDDVFAWRKYVVQQYAPFKFGWRTLQFTTNALGKLVLDIDRSLSVEEEAFLKQATK